MGFFLFCFANFGFFGGTAGSEKKARQLSIVFILKVSRKLYYFSQPECLVSKSIKAKNYDS